MKILDWFMRLVCEIWFESSSSINLFFFFWYNTLVQLTIWKKKKINSAITMFGVKVLDVKYSCMGEGLLMGHWAMQLLNCKDDWWMDEIWPSHVDCRILMGQLVTLRVCGPSIFNDLSNLNLGTLSWSKAFYRYVKAGRV